MRCITLTFLSFYMLAHAQAQIELQPNDHVAIVGGGFADRLQHAGWFEAKLHKLYPNHQLVVRNLACAGDEVTTWHRSQDFGSQDEWLKRVKADVILAFWGFNESFQGPDGVDSFKNDLATWVDAKRSKTYGKGSPRLVLFSPPAAEDTGNPDLPKAQPLNQNLALYAKATAEVTAEKEVLFVDLYNITSKLFAERDDQLTVNGLHLKRSSYKHLANAMLAPLVEEGLPKVGDLMVDAVREKNAKWFARYRTVDGYNVYGGRSKRVYSGVSNFEVMQEEMTQRDQQTANRDRAIWAITKGQRLTVTDDNLPAVQETPTNLPEHRIAPYPGPEEAIETMQLHSGMEINLFASEKEFPELANPCRWHGTPEIASGSPRGPPIPQRHRPTRC